jgi:NAD(P)-dependent dehydrogenase (short-subunit alcohol dehydrogenase family)
MQLDNKVCVIAGASGAIGASVANRFYQEGARLALTYRTEKPVIWGKEDLDDPSRLGFYKLDVTDYKNTEMVIKQISEDFSGIDALVNCTGVVGPIGPLETLDMQEWTRTIEINLIGSVHLVHAVLPIMKERGGGKIVFFSGGGAAYGRPFFTPYSSSKAALVRLTESLAEELASANIQVNAVAPGAVNSRMWKEMRAAAPSGGPALALEIKQMDETGGASPDRAAELAVLLASSRSDALTGRLLSAVWDDWEHIESHMGKIASSDVWTLRRIPLS